MFNFGYATLPHDESQYFKGIDTHNTIIPVGDVTAYRMYPQYRWVYNKLLLCEVQDIYAFPDGDINPPFPLFRKPIYNLYGMSAGAEPILNKEQYDNSSYNPGHFIMPLLTGDQYSTDVVVVKGMSVWYKSMLCYTDDVGSFTEFEISTPPTKVQHCVLKWIHDHLKDFTGVVNIETIDTTIIECHLRMSPQFVDLYGEGWLKRVVDVYAGDIWIRPKENDTGFSVPLRVKAPGIYELPTHVIDNAKQACRSIQVFLKPGKNHMVRGKDAEDNHSFRIAVVNGTERNHCEYALTALSNGLIKSS